MQEHLKLLKDLSVLIVEDDEIARELLIGGLKPYCLSVWGAADGLEGLERFKKLAPTIVITDIHMPAMNGFEMMKEMMRIKPAQNLSSSPPTTPTTTSSKASSTARRRF